MLVINWYCEASIWKHRNCTLLAVSKHRPRWYYSHIVSRSPKLGYLSKEHGEEVKNWVTVFLSDKINHYLLWCNFIILVKMTYFNTSVNIWSVNLWENKLTLIRRGGGFMFGPLQNTLRDIFSPMHSPLLFILDCLLSSELDVFIIL